MKILQILEENISMTFPLVVVDVQPAYESSIDFDITKLANVLNSRKGTTVMYVNAYDDTGTTDDSIQDIMFWWNEVHDVHENQLNSFKFIDKGYGYGYLREAIDSGTDNSDIIRVIRDMYQQKVTDSTDLYGGDESKIIEAYGEEIAEWFGYGISVDFVNVSWLKQLSPFYLCGGGRNECLAEVMLICDALNIKYKLLNEFVY